VLIESNPNSWNSPAYFERTREDWEKTANAALARAGSDQRIDRRSLLERGLARMPEPALRLAFHLKELRGVMVGRWGQFQAAKHFQSVEKRAKAAFLTVETALPERATARAEASIGAPARPDEAPAHKAERFLGWIERQIARLGSVAPVLLPNHARAAPAPERAPPRQPSPPDMER
jgi:hypothetical protein